MDLAARSLVISQCQHRAHIVVLRPCDTQRRVALRNRCKPVHSHYCCSNCDFSREDARDADHIESIWWPAGINCVDEVRGDYCHIEALVIITLVTELTGSLQWSLSAVLLMFRQQLPVNASTHHATHKCLSCVLNVHRRLNTLDRAMIQCQPILYIALCLLFLRTR